LRIYFDTSSLVSLYARDTNFSKAINAVPGKATKVITQFAELEFENALQLRVFRKDLRMSQGQLIRRNFQDDLRKQVYEYRLFDIGWLERAGLLSRRHTALLGTRTLDLIHVASALELEADSLFTFDEHQRSLAKAVHLKLN